MAKRYNDTIALEEGHRVAVVGGGPAGSLFSYFLLLFSNRFDRNIHVDIYEPRDFEHPGPAGCNMCGGIISESLVQALAVEGINLPDSVVQRGIESYVLHTEAGSCCINTPIGEKRIAAVHRGGGPRTGQQAKWQSFDAHLLKLAIAEGAHRHTARVSEIGWYGDKPQVKVKGKPPETYELLVGAVGMNSPDLSLFEKLGFEYQRPKQTKTYITELPLGEQLISSQFGDAMHLFLLDIPRLEFAAMIPKGDYVTTCLLGENIDRDLISSFFRHPAVRKCLPADWEPPANICHCSPKMFFGNSLNPFTDRVVLVGDAAVARLFKDGIGAAYRTAKAAARTAVFQGVSAADFRAHYWPQCQSIMHDNLFGRVIFEVVHRIKEMRIPASAVLRTIGAEEQRPGNSRRMSMVLWDTFTGSAPYKDIFMRTLHPSFIVPFIARNIVSALRSNWPSKEVSAARASQTQSTTHIEMGEIQ
ncbi:MAG: hypothetical protein HYX72_12455 [Acidobacteria bacterium]|nr:hypothetical protein [Acidobacteriota bacterium]